MGSEIQRIDSSASTTAKSSSTSCNGNKCNSPTLATSTTTSIPELTILIDEHDVQAGARRVLHAIRPAWKDEHIEFKLFTDGITNKLVGCFHRPPPPTLDEEPQEEQEDQKEKKEQNGKNHQNGNSSPPSSSSSSSSSPTPSESIDQVRENTVLIRVYGNKTDMLIDRKAETRNIRMLHEFGFAPSLFATFRNGLAYEYVPGVTLKPETVVLENIYTLVARQMAEMHKVRHEDVDPTQRVPMIESQSNKFLNLIPETLSDARKAQRAVELSIPSVSALRVEFASLYARLKTLGSPIVFAHNDLLLGNVIYTAEQERVTFIDYEYADYNYAAFDIGNHFTEFPGINEVDFSLYPGREFQLKWCRVYLEAFLGHPPTQQETEKLFCQVNQFALASHFLWLIWGLIQAEHSTIDFDFVKFASNRYNEYMKRRDEFLALTWEEEEDEEK